ncbi:glycoside hydrolase family 43 [Fusarium sporotrichioides]|uniref:Glycoside hydrolase family 43 n=1 Tax=Fusarium sporotrichioides TaxID=5514 RepID=A0A395S9T1_FUSSP|nr:glycoside hydrolase family 43 [Fusarium sporotrichioides]
MLYDDTLKMIDRTVRVMDRNVFQELGGDPRAYTTDDYAKLVCRHSKIIKSMAAVDNTVTFNLVLSMAGASRADPDTTVKICGEDADESARYFQSLDNLLLTLIEARERPAELAWQLLKVPARWSRHRTHSQDVESDEDPDEWFEPDLDNAY